LWEKWNETFPIFGLFCPCGEVQMRKFFNLITSQREICFQFIWMHKSKHNFDASGKCPPPRTWASSSCEIYFCDPSKVLWNIPSKTFSLDWNIFHSAWVEKTLLWGITEGWGANGKIWIVQEDKNSLHKLLYLKPQLNVHFLNQLSTRLSNISLSISLKRRCVMRESSRAI
jgi:hypothetical protein